jgi:hypothetical protein
MYALKQYGPRGAFYGVGDTPSNAIKDARALADPAEWKGGVPFPIIQLYEHRAIDSYVVVAVSPRLAEEICAGGGDLCAVETSDGLYDLCKDPIHD